MSSLCRRSYFMTLWLVFFILSTLPICAQIASGPWSRFMGDNYSNGLSNLLGPSLSAGLSFSVVTGPTSVPVVAPSGKVVISGGAVTCFSSSGTQLWSTGYTPYGYPPPPSFASQYGAPTNYSPAIGSDNTIYATTQGSGGYGGSGSPQGLVALDLNASGPGASVKWAWTTTNFYDAPSYSPVVGPDNTVYCVGHRPGTSGSTPLIWAFNHSISGNFKWKWPTSVDPNIITGQWEEPILYNDGVSNYIIVSGTMNMPPPPNTNQAITNTLRVAILKDSGTSATLLGDFYFPYSHIDASAQYSSNGAPSLSPDGSLLIVPWGWHNSGGYAYGLSCMNVNIPTGAMSLRWPALSPDVHVSPPASFIDSTTSGTPVRYTASIDGLSVGSQSTNAGVYSTTADGTTLLKRNLSTGAKIWQTTPGTAIGGQLPALDSSYHLWIGTSAGTAEQYDYLTGNRVQLVNVIDSVNGIGVSIGTGGYLYLTTTNNSTSAVNLRAVH